MESLKEQYKNPVFIEAIVSGAENPGDLIKIGRTNKFFYKNVIKNNLIWYYAMKKWYPHHASSKAVFNINKDYRRTFALQMGALI